MFVPLRDFGNLLDELIAFLMPWSKLHAQRLRAVIENRPMRSIEWGLYYGEPITAQQVEKRIKHLYQFKNLTSEDKFILRWLQKNLTHMQLRAAEYEDPKFNL